jgi:hypothetical protein
LNQTQPPWFLEPQWFFPFFVLIWLGVSGLLALVSGWWSLATHFRTEDSVQGGTFRFASGSMGARLFPVHYGNCLFVTVNENGFGLAILFLFRMFCPPLFIPWSAIASIEPKRFLLFSYTLVRLREQWPTISLRGSAGREIEQAYARSGGPNVP